MIIFNEREHTYTHTKTDEKYISVTTLLSKYKVPFDKNKHSLRVANREGVPQEMVLEMWREENKRATSKGTKIHKLMEDYVVNGKTEENYGWLYGSYDKAVKTTIEKHNAIYSESLLYNDYYKIAGTADLIYDHGNYFTVGDFKTNKKFTYTSSYNEHFMSPIDHLMYCEHNTYALQMSLYAYMYEQLSSKKCKQVIIFYLQDSVWQPVYCNYMKSDVLNILDHYKQKIV